MMMLPGLATNRDFWFQACFYGRRKLRAMLASSWTTEATRHVAFMVDGSYAPCCFYGRRKLRAMLLLWSTEATRHVACLVDGSYAPGFPVHCVHVQLVARMCLNFIIIIISSV